MLTKTLSEAKKKQRSILIKAMNNDIGSIDSAKDSWNPAQISERAKDISYIRSLVDTWNPAQLNEALKMLDLPVIDTWNPAQIEEQRRNLVFYLAERTLTGNPITLKILGNLTPEVTGLKVSMSPIQDLHGYSNPWVGGAGKNKVPLTVSEIKSVNTSGTWSGNDYTWNGVTYTILTDGGGNVVGIDLYGTASAFSILYIQENNVHTNLTQGIYSFSSGTSGSSSTTSRCYIEFYNTETDSWVGIATDTAYPTYETNKFRNCRIQAYTGTQFNHKVYKPQVESGTSPTTFAPYSNICPISGRTEASVTRTAGEDVETKTHQYSETIYGGVDDFVNGGLTNEWGYIASYDGETLPGVWISDRDAYAPDTTPSTGAEVAYRLETPTTIETTPEEITLLKGENVLSTDGDSIELKYKQNF